MERPSTSPCLEFTRDTCSLSMVANLRTLLCQMLISPVIVAIVAAIIRRMMVQLSSLERVAPKYLKLFTSSNRTLFMSISALLLTRVLTITSAIVSAGLHSCGLSVAKVLQLDVGFYHRIKAQVV